jgi:muramoyltetrapeptide carboxypeptidase LdcA involved in peptidoglycan recycling
MIKGTSVWPSQAEWEGAVLFLETSEEAPAPDYVIRCLRNYAATGILNRLSAIILGRPANVQDDQLHQYDEALFRVVNKEEGLTDLLLMTQMDFGHTDPMFLLPYGALAEVDPLKNKFSILENAVI